MTKTNAKKSMENFMNKYKNQIVRFANLNDDEKFVFILIDSMNYFKKFLKANEALERALKNAKAHKESNFEHFDRYGNKILKIAE